jgi:hypothetical protein
VKPLGSNHKKHCGHLYLLPNHHDKRRWLWRMGTSRAKAFWSRTSDLGIYIYIYINIPICISMFWLAKELFLYLHQS